MDKKDIPWFTDVGGRHIEFHTSHLALLAGVARNDLLDAIGNASRRERLVLLDKYYGRSGLRAYRIAPVNLDLNLPFRRQDYKHKDFLFTLAGLEWLIEHLREHRRPQLNALLLDAKAERNKRNAGRNAERKQKRARKTERVKAAQPKPNVMPEFRGPWGASDEGDDSGPTSALVIPDEFRRIHTNCKVADHMIGGDAVPSMEAYDLWFTLEKNEPYQEWWDHVLERVWLQKGSDFESYMSDHEPRLHTYLTVSAVKRVAIVEGVGNSFRDYFLWRDTVGVEIPIQPQPEVIDEPDSGLVNSDARDKIETDAADDMDQSGTDGQKLPIRLVAPGSALQPFDFNGSRFLSVVIDGQAYFIGMDVAIFLGYKDPDQALRQHCKSLKRFNSVKLTELGMLNPPASGLGLIPERDVYRMTMRSTMPQAQVWEEWVVGTVLPSIRKTGAYVHADYDDPEEVVIARGLAAANAALERHKQRAELAETEIKEHWKPTVDRLTVEKAAEIQAKLNAEEIAAREASRAEEYVPKVECYDEVINRKGLHTYTEVAGILEIKRGYLITLLLNPPFKWHYRLGHTASGRLQPYKTAIDDGYMKIELGERRDMDDPDGKRRLTTETSRVTEKGIDFLRMFLKRPFGLVA